MVKANVHISSLIGSGDTPVERATVSVAPAYQFRDGVAINYEVPTKTELVSGQATINGFETKFGDDDMVWKFSIAFTDGARNNYIGGETKTKTFPPGTVEGATVEYADLIDVDTVTIPGYGPTYAEQARADAELAESAASTATSAAAEAVSAAAGAGAAAADAVAPVATELAALEASLPGTYVTFRKTDGTPLAGRHVIITVDDAGEIDNITSEAI